MIKGPTNLNRAEGAGKVMYAKIAPGIVRKAYVEDEFGIMSAGFRLDGGKPIDHLCELEEEREGVISFTSPLRAFDKSGLTKYSRFVAFQFQGLEMSVFLIVPAPADEKWACLDDGPVPWETWKELPPIELGRRWWVGNLDGVEEPKYVVPDELDVYQISLFRFEWPAQRCDGGLISVTVCVRRQSDIDAEEEYYRKREESVDKTGLPQAQDIVTRVLHAIGLFESFFDTMPEERAAWELVKERLCLRLAYVQEETSAVSSGSRLEVRAHDVLECKRGFFGEDARLEHPEPSDKEAAKIKRTMSVDLLSGPAEIKRTMGVLFRAFAPADGQADELEPNTAGSH